jgi:hypothetical protein
MSDKDFSVFFKMWRDDPDTARGVYEVGIDYLIAEGDDVVNIAERFGMPWQRLVEGAVKRWAMDTSNPPGGLESFKAGNEIKIQAPQEAWQNAFAPLDPEQMVSLWTGAPATAALLFPAGRTYAIGEGDTLAKLGEKFGVPWESIAEATMGTSDPKAINSWLAENGGKKLPSGYWAFSPGQEVRIPPPAADAVPSLDAVLADVGRVTGEELG